MDNTNEFIRLVQENPNLPIIPMVNAEVVCNDYYGWWLGSFGYCEVTEYACVNMYNEDRYVTRDDLDEIEEYFMNELLDEDETLSAEEVEALAIERAEALDWTKAIVVYIGTP